MAERTEPTYEELQRRLALMETALLAFRDGDAASVSESAEHQDLQELLAAMLERQDHIKQVLLAIRNVNQLIIAENDPQRLIERTCAQLTERPGYYNAWIALQDETGAVTMTASAGLESDFAAMQEQLQRGELPRCMLGAVAQNELVVIEDPQSACPECPLVHDYADRAGLACRLAYDNRVYGTLTVSIPAAYAHDSEERDLLGELAGDIAFALRKIADAAALARQEAELRATLYGIGDAVISTDRQNRVTRMNRVAEKLTGWTEAEAVGKALDEVFHIVNEETQQRVESPVARVLREGTVVGLANHTVLISRDGGTVPIADSGAPILGPQDSITGVVLVFRDQSEERLARRLTETRLALIEYAADHSLDELLRRALDEVAALASSAIAFYHFVEADQKTLTLQQWSSRTVQECCKVEAKGMHYDIDEAGVWVDCVHERAPVVHNDYASLPHRKGLPEGHAEVVRELVVPVLRDDRVVAILGVGNKPTDYTDRDVEIVSYLADVTWEIVRQKRAEEVLRASEERFRSLYHAMTEGVCAHELVYDDAGAVVDYRIIGVNPSYEKILGLQREDVVGNLGSQVYGTAEAPYLDVFGGVAQTGTPVQFDTYFPPMDRHFLISVFSPGKDKFATVFMDISEQKRSEQALREREALVQSIFRAAPTGIGLVSNRMILDVNERFCEMTGYTREELIGRNARMLYRTDEDYEYVGREKYRQIVARGTGTVETRFKRKDGRIIDVLMSSTPLDPDDLAAGVTFTALDITESKRAEEALRESEERFRALVEAAPMAILLMRGGKYLYANPASARMLGFDQPGEIFGVHVLDTIAPEFHKLARERMTRLDSGEDNPPVEMQFRKADGEPLWCISTSVAIHIGGEPTAVIVAQDISKRKQAEADRARMEEQFRQAQKLESIGRLAGGVAHDLNNLLSPILGYSDLLLEEIGDDELYRESLEEIVRAAERARDLVGQLLAFSRKQALEFKQIDLNALLTTFEKLLRRTIREDVGIRMVLAQSLPPIQGDAGQLEQVIMNLAVNAQDAMPDGGELTIETAEGELDECYATEHEGVVPGPFVLLVISDTGSGMDAEIRSHLFEPFFTTKEKDKGTGLGLATVYGIVKQHGGLVWVYSEPGHGSTFKIYLPVSEGLSGVSRQVPRSLAELGGSETILLVEDNEQVRLLASTVLKRRGYTVLVAGSGKEALSMLEGLDGPLHLVLTDVVMPEMNGKELYQQVAAFHPEARALYMSGYTDNVIVHRGVMDPGIHFIQKPFTNKALTTKIREVLTEEPQN